MTLTIHFSDVAVRSFPGWINGWTALEVAIERGHREIVRLLQDVVAEAK
jgi:ankyrin repeat protein